MAEDTESEVGRAPRSSAAGVVSGLVAAASLPPLAVRSVLLVEAGVSPGAPDLRGFAADVAASLLFVVLLLWACRRPRWLGLGSMILWCAIHYANYEHVKTLGSPAGLANAGYLADPTFLLGSALAPTSPLLLLGMGVACVGLVWRCGSGRGEVGRLRPWLITALVLGVGSIFWRPDPDALAWRQVDVVYENVRWIVERPLARRRPRAVVSSKDPRVRALFRADLAGQPILELGHRGQNVLLVMLEGISGVHLASSARRQGIEAAIAMPHLDRIAAEGLRYDRFVSHNRQTNRGEYAILCGDYPKLTSWDEPKMTEHLGGSQLACLPRVLHDSGYETVYLQSAPLGFMSKDAFMPQAGFSQVHGEEWFERAYARNRWGIDDRAYFEQSLTMVEELRAAGRPWFLTLLTVGTHHPYVVPRSAGGPSFAKAVPYLDDALSEFMARITELGVLEDTLVLITSDESVGLGGYRGARLSRAEKDLDDLTRKLTQSWSFLIVREPTRRRASIEEPFVQADVALSVLDYLGLTGDDPPFSGRSVFRRYEQKRPIVFGNVYMRSLGVVTPDDGLSVCSESFDVCASYASAGGWLFSKRRRERAADEDAIAFLRAMVEQTRWSAPPRDREREIELLAKPAVALLDSRDMQVIFGGQYWRVPAHTRVDVDLDVRVDGTGGSVRLDHLLKSGGGHYHFKRTLPALRPGDELVIRYSFTAAEDLQSVENLASATRLEPGEISLRFETARMRLVPPEDGRRDAPGLEVHELRVKRAGDG